MSHVKDALLSHWVTFCSLAQGINIIKFYTWEDAFTDAINAIRTQEIKWLREKAIVTIKMYAIMAAAPVACVLVSIGCYICKPHECP